MKSILQSDYPKDRLEIIVIDDASTDGTCRIVKNLYPQVKIIRTGKEVFPAKSRDLGARHATGDYLFFIDDDCLVSNDTITCLTKTALAIGEKAGIVAPVITYEKIPYQIWCAGGVFRPNAIRDLVRLCENLNLDVVQAEHKLLKISFSPSAFLLRRREYMGIGGFNYIDFPIAWEEAEIALRFKYNGYQNVCVTSAVVVHDIELGGGDKARTPIRAYYQGKSRVIFYRKYLWRKSLLMPVYVFGFILQNQNAILAIKYLHGTIDGFLWR
jgi:GT2 family glycosyltransferase